MEEQHRVSLHTVLQLAVASDCCERTAKKAILHGAGAVRGRTGERIAEAAARLGIQLARLTNASQ